jgi:hypothetical protein
MRRTKEEEENRIMNSTDEFLKNKNQMNFHESENFYSENR